MHSALRPPSHLALKYTLSPLKIQPCLGAFSSALSYGRVQSDSSLTVCLLCVSYCLLLHLSLSKSFLESRGCTSNRLSTEKNCFCKTVIFCHIERQWPIGTQLSFSITKLEFSFFSKQPCNSFDITSPMLGNTDLTLATLYVCEEVKRLLKSYLF